MLWPLVRLGVPWLFDLITGLRDDMHTGHLIWHTFGTVYATVLRLAISELMSFFAQNCYRVSHLAGPGLGTSHLIRPRLAISLHALWDCMRPCPCLDALWDCMRPCPCLDASFVNTLLQPGLLLCVLRLPVGSG